MSTSAMKGSIVATATLSVSILRAVSSAGVRPATPTAVRVSQSGNRIQKSLNTKTFRHYRNCCLACSTEDGLKPHNQTWMSSTTACVTCQCLNGVKTCSPLPCPCSANSGPTAAVDRCCPQCRSATPTPPPMSSHTRSSHSKCRHQELANTTFDSGHRWIYQCQSCECLVLIC